MLGTKSLPDSERSSLSHNYRLLAVARWPLGGIRTYMRYVYKHLPPHCQVTIIAASTPENDALERDAAEIKARVVLSDLSSSTFGLTKAVFNELRTGSYDIIQSHGFISAAHAYAANLAFSIPHVLTVHGILEERFLAGVRGRIKAALASHVIRNVDVVYAVSNDILGHLYEEIPGLEQSRCKKVVIHNGIDVERFNRDSENGEEFRRKIGVDAGTFLIGFLGRFMQQKGFNYLVDAVEMLEGDNGIGKDFKVLAVGSGDYLGLYKKTIDERNLQHRFIFLPFQSDVAKIYSSLDVVVMPSIWEASGLLAMEAMCSGVPLIASNCIGLRETTKDTPAIVFESKDSNKLAAAINQAMRAGVKSVFEAFSSQACVRYDVRRCARAVHEMFAGILQGRENV